MRAICAFAVILIHVCAMQWRILDIHSGQWLFLHVYDMSVKFCVPVFFMISGRFLLDNDRELTVNKLIRKEKHIVISFVFWSMLYTMLNIGRVVAAGQNLQDHIKWIIVEFFTGEYHMWFLYAIFGLYLVAPILRKVVEDKKITQYFIILFLIFGCCWPVLEILPKIGVLFTEVGTSMVFTLATGMSGYFVLGYYLHKYPISDKRMKLIYALGIVSTVFSVSATLVMSWKTGTANEQLVGYLTPNVAMASIAVYSFCLRRFEKKRPGKIVNTVAKYSFGCYLIHPLFCWIFEWVGIVPDISYTLITVPIISVLILFLSLLLAMLFSKVPYLRRVI